ncbi:hypothetical protein ACFXA4_34035 [Streptomyces sp. NPDC059442]|uniref:hypothetical protein n=1 Tax=Streptomyces sp. NPDC059442 TaxID=3346830 RepID=UPI00367E6640
MFPSRATSRARTGRRTAVLVCALLVLGVTADGVATASSTPRPGPPPWGRDRS